MNRHFPRQRFLVPASLMAIAAFPAGAFGQYAGATAPPADVERGFRAITERKARAIDGYLASPELEGRGTGQPGFQKAADYVAAHFKAAGLRPMGDNGTYFQSTTFYRTWATNVRIANGSGGVLTPSQAVLNVPREKVDVEAPVVVVHAAGPKDVLNPEDADRLEGKIVIENIPAGSSAIRSQVARESTKATFLVVDGKLLSAPAVSRGPAGAGTSIVSGRMTRAGMFALCPGLSQDKVGAAGAGLIDPGVTAHISAEPKTEPVTVSNVVGLLEGSDPTLKDEYIGIGGHLDHLGLVNGVIFPGADDDGSGSTAVMLIADAMAHNRMKPKRSILFMTFFGEEMGLLGSSYLTSHPPVPLNKMIAELQMDMIARDSYGPQNNDPNRMDKVEENLDTMRLVGSKRISTDLDRIIQEENEHIKFRFRYDAEDVYTRSDHYNFARNGIPIAFLFDGFTPDYHRPTDTVDKIDFKKLVSAARLYYLTLFALADRPEAPRHDVKQ